MLHHLCATGPAPQVGGEKGNILIWDVARNCLLYDIAAHDGKVFDCGWSGDSRRLLSVGSDGKARLWDVAAGSELCQVGRRHGAARNPRALACLWPRVRSSMTPPTPYWIPIEARLG